MIDGEGEKEGERSSTHGSSPSPKTAAAKQTVLKADVADELPANMG